MPQAKNIVHTLTRIWDRAFSFRQLAERLGGGLLLLLFSVAFPAHAQKVRYVEHNSTHALSVPENPDYSFEWSMTWGNQASVITILSKTNVTENITWSHEDTHYDITVFPVDSFGCMGEPVQLIVYTVDYLSLHAFHDVFYTRIDEPVTGDVSENDFDEFGNTLYYNPTLITEPSHGSLESGLLGVTGEFTYTPDPGFVGIDYFVYEVYTLDYPSMYITARVTIVVKDDETEAELYVEKTGPEKALYGDEIGYTIKIINYGLNNAEDVMLTDSIPYGLYDAEYSLGTVFHDWNDSILIGDIDAGDSVIVTIKATISLSAPDGIWNQALVYSPVYDPDYTNNDSIWYTEIGNINLTLTDYLKVPGCESVIFPNNIESRSEIESYTWTPSTGLNDSTLKNPLFTPDESTYGTTIDYILQVTDFNGNVVQDTMTVYVANLPVAQIESDTLFKNIGENIYISGSESSGDDIDFEWSTVDGNIVQGILTNTIEIDTTGIYFLLVEDSYECESTDSVVVLLESHPPVAINDKVEIEAGTDSTVNVLDNDYDINGFDLRMTGIVTPPNHGIWSWDDTTFSGNITFMPDIDYWLLDSIQYEVCNNGYPEKCSYAWLIIDCLRPPLNADVQVTKTSDLIAFWGDTIEYDITIYNNGPDTAFVTVFDDLKSAFSNAKYSIDEGKTWKPWTNNFYTFSDSILPIEDVFRLKIKAYIHPEAERYITNTAWIKTDIKENNYENDTSTCVTKIKEKVIARAGPDLIVGSCEQWIDLDGTGSEGEEITYQWSPADNLIGANTSTPRFNVTESANYYIILTVTDDDGIQDTDTLILQVLPPPLAIITDSIKFLRKGDQIALDGSKSSGTGIEHSWETPDGRISLGQGSERCVVDSVGTYILTVTDQAGCTNSDTVKVYWFYFDPFAIPDYYSTQINRSISGNVLYNDYEPNGLFNLYVSSAGTFHSTKGGTVTLAADGQFTYTPPPGFSGDIDNFTYEVCNDAEPVRCSTGYVEITVNNTTKNANLSVTKEALQETALIGYDKGMLFKITVKNNGPDDATGVLITDSLSKYLTNTEFSFNGITFQNKWTGSFTKSNLAVNDSITIYIRAKVTDDAPDRVFNAVTVASDIFDPYFDWDDVNNRNVDTTSIAITSDLQAVADLVENFDDNHFDAIIGCCDNLSYLDGSDSKTTSESIDYYLWGPSAYVATDSAQVTFFSPASCDTTITFNLIVGVGDRVSTASVEVTFSPEVIADAGPNRKLNEGEPLTIDGTNSQGAGATYSWYLGSQLLTNFDDNPLMPIVTTPGSYRLEIVDMHGCTDADTVIIQENQLFAMNDIMIVIENDTVTGNVATNDYDPNGDSIYYTGIVEEPQHGTLWENPPNRDGTKSVNIQYDRISSDGTFIYEPEPGYIGFDYFTYELCDNNDPDLCVWGKVYIKVIDVDLTNSPPVANHDHLFVNMNDTLYENILANDFDFDGGLITLDDELIEGVQQGSLQLNENGDIVYIPNAGSVGTEQFTYRIWDNGNPSEFDTATVTIEIHKIPEENHKPVAVDDAFYIVEKEITGDLLKNDYDPDGDEFLISIYPVVYPEHGTLNIDYDGSFTYSLNEDFEGTDQFVYKIYEQNNDTVIATATALIVSLDQERYYTDVAIAKTGPVDTLSGTRIQWELVVSIVGPTLANDIEISDTIFAGLAGAQYSTDDGESWRIWSGTFTDDEFEQMMLYEQRSILIRASIPDIFSGELPNTAWVNHGMNETVTENNDSTWITDVYQRVIARPGNDTLIGSCDTHCMLDGTASVGMGELEYRWSPTNRVSHPGDSITEFTVDPEDAREFTLIVSCTYGRYTDSDTASVWVERAETPVAYAGEDQWPELKDPVLLDGSGSTGAGPLKYLWWVYNYEGDKDYKAYHDTVTVMQSGDYYLTITDKFSCDSTDLMHVGYPIDPYQAMDEVPCIETAQQESVDIYVLRNDSIDPDDEYDLDYLMVIQQPSHGYIIENSPDSMFTYVPDDYYVGYDTFTYIASTYGSQPDEAKVCIIVLERSPNVPEGFSPNADGINDFLIIENIEKYEYNRLIVFNRWGNVVYEKEKYSNDEPWDGIANKGVRIGNGPLPAGVYLYVLDLGDEDKLEEDRRILKGNIYIASDTR